jgi:serine/threonine protein kinase
MPYIAEGSYGCVFSPPLKCLNNKKTTSNQAGKIFYSKDSMEEEKELAEKINKIDPNGKWTIPYYGSCFINVKETRQTDNIDKCNKYSKHIPITEQLIYKNGGIDLNHFTNNFEFFKNNIFIDDLIPLFYNLLKGLKSLNEKQIAHCDIKPPNMLYDFNEFKLYIIDFGLTTPYNNISSFSNYNMLNHIYPYYPPEFKIYFQLIIHNKTTVNTNDILENYSRYLPRGFFDFMSKYIDIPLQIKQFVIKCQKNKEVFKHKFKTEYVSKIDVFSLGMTFVEIFYRLSIKSQIKLKNKTFFDNFMKLVIVPMISMDADQRYDSIKTYNSLKILLKKYNKKTDSSSSLSSISNIKIPVSNCNKLKRTEIVELLKKQNKPVYGNKSVLCDRLNNIIKSPKNIKTPEKIVIN